MSLNDDLACLRRVVETDPAFGSVDREALRACLAELRGTEGEETILGAMRVLALAGNGHTRVIPNRAIQIVPLRFVALGEAFVLTEAVGYEAQIGQALVSVNGVAVEDVLARACPYLSGTASRQRVIGGIVFAWPAALERLGVLVGDRLRYEFEGGAVDVPVLERIPGLSLYPQNEHGRAEAAWVPDSFVDMRDWPGLGLSIRLPSFFDVGETALVDAMQTAAAALAAPPPRALVIDVRGNTGGDFLRTMPLIDAVAAQAAPCAVLVDKFTFSAAIVFVALLKHRLGDPLLVVGEPLGDGLRFFAEGGLMDLPGCGAAVRYSTALHDWESGVADATTPVDIAAHLVGVGRLEIDQPYAVGFSDLETPDAVYPDLLRQIGRARP